MTPIPVPTECPEFPPVPEGYSRWEYRGMGWSSRAPVVYGFWRNDRSFEGSWRMASNRHPGAIAALHYIEAVRDRITALEIPDGLPRLPALPEGYDYWEYRGEAWEAPTGTAFCFYNPALGDDRWRTPESFQHTRPQGVIRVHYMEAMRGVRPPWDRPEPQQQAYPVLTEDQKKIIELEDKLLDVREACRKELKELHDRLNNAWQANALLKKDTGKLQLQISKLQKESDLLSKLIDAGGSEDSKGGFRVILEYDNYHDGAIIRDGDENMISSCYGHNKDIPEDQPELQVQWQYRKAIEDLRTESPQKAPPAASPGE